MSYDTDAFRFLRQAADNSFIAEELRSVSTELNSLRSSAMCSGDSFIKAGWATWDILAKLDEDSNVFALPARYTSEELEIEFTYALISIYNLECGEREPGNHRVYHGVKGVGKTTFLHVLGAVAACLTEKTLPIYWNFETNDKPPRPSQLVQAAACFFGDTSSRSYVQIVNDIVDVPEQSTSSNYELRPLLLLDEFTSLYFAGNNAATADLMKRGASIMRELLVRGKQQHNCIYLAASRANVHRYIYPAPESTDATQPGREFAVYPNMNNSVFMVREITPIRDIESIQKYILSRHKIALSEHDANEVFCATGGIGRFIRNWHKIKHFETNIPIYQIHSNDGLYRLCTAIVTSRCQSITFSEAKRIAGDVSQLWKWSDDLILRVTYTTVEFLIPDVGKAFLSGLENEKDRQRAALFYLSHVGFDGGSPGHSNEALISKFVHKIFPSSVENCLTSTLKFLTNNAVVLNEGNNTVNVSKDNFPWNKLLKWQVIQAGEGLDGIFVNLLFENTVEISGFQLKTGRGEKSIIAGVLATQRRNRASCQYISLDRMTAGNYNIPDNKNRGRVVQVDDRTIAGILVKAEAGLWKLAFFLNRYFGFRVQFGDLYILTDKKALRGFNDFATALVSPVDYVPGESFQFTTNCNETFVNFPENILDSYELTVRVYEGLEWVRQILPESIGELACGQHV